MTVESQNHGLDVLLANRQWAHALARRLVGDANLAEDIVQTACLAAIERPPRHDQSPRGWIAAVIRNLSLMALRSGGRRARRERLAPTGLPAAAAPDVVARAERQRSLTSLVLELDEPYRTTVLLRYFDDLEPHQIAARLGEPAGTIRSRLKRAIAQLRERMAERHGDSWPMTLAPLLIRLPPKASAVAAGTGTATVVLMRWLPALLFGATLVTGIWWAGHVLTSAPQTRTAQVAAGEPAPAVPSAAATDPDTSSATPSTARVVPHPGPLATTTGVVLDTEGNPIADADVIAYPLDIIRAVSDDPSAPALRGVVRATTNDQGEFTLPATAAGGLVNLYVRARRAAPTVMESRHLGGHIAVTLAADRPATGLVTDAAGTPVSGASIDWIAYFSGIEIHRTATTSSGGTFELNEIPETEALRQTRQQIADRLVVTARGFAPTCSRLPEADPTRGRYARITLGRGCAVTGTINDSVTRSPIAGATIFHWPDRHKLAIPGPDVRWLNDTEDARGATSVVAHADGTFRFDHLEEGRRCMIGAIAPGYAPVVAEVELAGEGESTAITLLATQPAVVHGRVVTSDGRPVAAARVARTPHYDDGLALPAALAAMRGATITDADGYFSLDGLPVGSGEDSVEIQITAPWTRFGTDAARRVAVRSGESSAAGDVVIGEPLGIQVSVVDRAGAPIADVALSTKMFIVPRTEAEQPLRTDAKGRARLTFPAQAPSEPPRAVRIYARAPGRARAFTGLVTPGRGVDEPAITITLQDEVALTGKVVDEHGRPVVGALVMAMVQPGAPRTVEEIAEDLAGQVPPSDSWCAMSTSRDGGFFKLRNLPSERLQLAVRGGDAAAPTFAIVPDVVPGETPMTLVLPLGGAGRGVDQTTVTLRGRLHIDGGSLPQASSLGFAHGAEFILQGVTLEADGSFTAVGLRPGTSYKPVLASWRNGELQTWVASGSVVLRRERPGIAECGQIRMTAAGLLSIQTTSSSATRSTLPTQIDVRSELGERVYATCGVRLGESLLTVLPAGRHRITLWFEDGSMRTAPIVVEPFRTLNFDVGRH